VALLTAGVLGVVLLAVVFMLVTARHQAATGQLDRETLRADRSGAADHTPAPLAGRTPGPRPAQEVAGRSREIVRYVPVGEDELGVTRRRFLNRGILTALALGVGAFGSASVAFIWPHGGGGFGGKTNIGPVSDVQKAIAGKQPYYNAAAKTYMQPYPKSALAKAARVYAPAVLAGMKLGFVALYQKCPHLGCRVPWCFTSQWFECPCHGSKYNRVGEKKGGPAPRGMDRFAFTVSGGNIVVDTSTVIQGPPIGTDTTGQGQEGAACV
jgi:cytochrome b6-f complex iron-sulfur subunit